MIRFTRIVRRGRARRLCIALVASMLFLGLVYQDEIAEIGAGLQLFQNVYNSVHSGYVDHVRPVQLAKAAIRGMLSVLDPYTTFVDEADHAEVDMITLGSYGGVGITLSNRGGRHFISAFVEEDQRQRSPLRLGDEIIGVGNVTLDNTPAEDLRRMLRGAPDSPVALVIRRPGIRDTLRVTVLRHSVAVRTVSIFDTVAPGIYYIKLDRFTRKAVEDLHVALRTASMHRDLRGVILDLRDNPGGLLEAAVDIVGSFVPNRSLIVTTRGRLDKSTASYSTEDEPIIPDAPLVVLINQQSASASEICAGAIQDLDRGVVLGARSFGKGVVQHVLPLGTGASLKMTTAKYYIPSGRCIQKTDYATSKKDGAIVPENRDSARQYSTRSGRAVREAGGIEPDVAVPDDSLPEPVRAFVYNGIILDFVSRQMNQAPRTMVPAVDAAMRRQFKAFADSAFADTLDAVTRAYRRMIESARRGSYSASFFAKASSLESLMREEREKILDIYWEELRREIRSQFAFHIGAERMRFPMRAPHDTPLQRAIALLSDPAKYAVALRSEH
jgi:carboxyl-terminal processing protease